MLTAFIVLTELPNAPPFWEWHHFVILVVVGIVLDLCLGLAIAATVASVRWATGRPSALAELRAIAAVLARLDRVIIVLGCTFLVLLVAITFGSVIGRNVYRPIPDDITIAEWAMVALVMVMLGTTQGRGEHIEVTALADVLPVRVNRALRLIGALLGVGFIGLFAWVNYPEVADSFLEETYGSIYALPRWPPRLVFFVGIAVWLARIYAQAAVLMADAVRPLPPDAVDLAPLLPADSGTQDEESGAHAIADVPDRKGERIGDGA